MSHISQHLSSFGSAQRQLADVGWTLLTRVGGRDAAEAILASFGELVPQDRSELRYDVRAEAEAAGLSSSKSANPLNPHTEASYRAEVPRLLALWCRRAARCGGGQTILADGAAIFEHLGDADRQSATEDPVEFGDASRPVRYRGPVVSSSGPPFELRFSYNLLRFGSYDPPIANMATVGPASLPRERLAERFCELFGDLQEPLDIPDDGLLVIDNRRMLHSRAGFRDVDRHLVRYWLS